MRPGRTENMKTCFRTVRDGQALVVHVRIPGRSSDLQESDMRLLGFPMASCMSRTAYSDEFVQAFHLFPYSG